MNRNFNGFITNPIVYAYIHMYIRMHMYIYLHMPVRNALKQRQVLSVRYKWHFDRQQITNESKRIKTKNEIKDKLEM